MRTIALLAILLITGPAVAEELARPTEGECTVCARRGGAHGTEEFVDWREHDGKVYGFCNEQCGEAFDQMPEGYADPVLPRPAPSIEWTTVDDAAFEPNGSMLLVDFWATWCTPCLESVPDLEALDAEFDELRVVGVSIDEKRSTLDRFLRKTPIDYAIVHDGGDDPAWWRFRVPAIPAAFLIDGEGRVVDQWHGKLDVDEVRSAIARNRIEQRGD